MFISQFVNLISIIYKNWIKKNIIFFFKVLNNIVKNYSPVFCFPLNPGSHDNSKTQLFLHSSFCDSVLLPYELHNIIILTITISTICVCIIVLSR